MKRFAWASLLALPLLAAGPGETLPLPPIPPPPPAMGDAAPVPDINLFGPPEVQPQGVRITPRLFRPKTYTKGDGYMPGSTFEQGENERQKKIVPGFDLRVPLQ